MMLDESSNAAFLRVASDQQIVIEYGHDVRDLQFPEVSWWIYGLPLSNEIAVVARVGSLNLALTARSKVLIPPMINRCKQMDESDITLALDLQAQLWQRHAPELGTEAIRIRRAS